MSSGTIDQPMGQLGGQIIPVTKTTGGSGKGGGRFDNWDEGRDALVNFLKDMKAIMKFLIDERIPDGPQALFQECFPDVEKNVDEVIKQLQAISWPDDEILERLRKVELDQKALDLKLREFYERLDQNPPPKGLKVGNTIMGSLGKVFPILEPVGEYKEIVESRIENGGDRGLILLNLNGRERR